MKTSVCTLCTSVSSNSNEKCINCNEQSKPLTDQESIISSDGPNTFFRALLILALTGISLLSLSYITYVIDPQGLAIKIMVNLSEGSFLFKIWKKPPLPVKLEVYIFNVTNPNEFLSGKEKLRVKEVGPYVFREHLEHNNITWNSDGTLSYQTYRSAEAGVQLKLDTEQGRGLNDTVIMPNIALLAIASKLADYSLFTQMGFAALANTLDSQPFETLTVDELLWGHPDPYVKMANVVASSVVTFKELGILDRLFDANDEVKIGLNNFTILEYNGKSELSQGYNITDEDGNIQNKCRETLRGSTEGVLFPKNMASSNVRIYRQPFCRTLELERMGEVPLDESFDVPGAIKYRIPPNAFNASSNPEHECHCGKESNNKECRLKAGLSDIGDCWFGIPAAASFPHFLHADPSLLEQIDGLNPRVEMHEPHIVVQEKLGLPVGGHVRMQINLVVRKSRFIKRISRFNNLVVPLLWVHWSLEYIPPSLQWLLDLCFKVAPTLQYGFIYGSASLGVSLLLTSFIGYLCYSNDTADYYEDDEQIEESSLNSSRNSSSYHIVIDPMTKPNTDTII